MIEKSILSSAGVEGMKITCIPLIACGDECECWVHPSDNLSNILPSKNIHTAVTEVVLTYLTWLKSWCYHVYHTDNFSTDHDNRRSQQTQQGPQQQKVTERCCSSCPHLWIDHTLLSAIWPLNTLGSFRHVTEAPESLLWASEMFHFFQWACCWGSCEGVSLIWMLNRKHLPGVRKIHLSVIFYPAQHPIQPSSSQSGREVVRKN